MKSESGVSFAIACQPFLHLLIDISTSPSPILFLAKVSSCPKLFHIFYVKKLSLKKCTLKCVPKYGQICIFGAYLDAPNMVKWGRPEKILQNEV